MEINLESSDAALVFRADGSMELAIPDRPGREDAPGNVVRCVQVAAGLQDPEVIAAIESAWGRISARVLGGRDS